MTTELLSINTYADFAASPGRSPYLRNTEYLCLTPTCRTILATIANKKCSAITEHQMKDFRKKMGISQ
ncbi:hypothetical protein AB0756_39830 [Tolypothrix campylonemoides VB511288_2]|uniref:Uncharacterized protein n=1 Tax=Tolypothrix campylonemoides VB511288_2 TaxID=3232311 RepID=A0ABW8XNI4_9CYAN